MTNEKTQKGRRKECFIRLHGARKEFVTGRFESIASAKKWIRECWDRPYTLVIVKQKTQTNG